MRQTLSLAFILKNEAKTIAGVIDSFRWDDGHPLYDELVVGIDDATTDNTLDVVRKYTDHISFFKFEDDFSKARNAILDKCKMDWIFMPDGHEYLDPESRSIVEHVLTQAPEDTWLISPYVGIVDHEIHCCSKKCSVLENMPSFLFPRPMFCRNRPDVRFKNPIHNYLDAPIEHKKIMPELLLMHKQAPERRAERDMQRFNMNIKGLQDQVKQNPDDSRAAFYLANTFGDLNDLDPAIKWYKKSLEITGNEDQRAQTRITLAYLLCQQGNKGDKSKFGEARDQLIPALNERWDRREIYFLLAWACHGLEDYQEAHHWLCAGKDLEVPITGFWIMPEMYTHLYWDSMMAVKHKIGDIYGTLDAAQKVLEFRPYCETAMYNVTQLREYLENLASQNILNFIAKGEQK